jgi:hypothetical protein
MSLRTGSTADVLAECDELGHLPPTDVLNSVWSRKKAVQVTEALTALAVAVAVTVVS